MQEKSKKLANDKFSDSNMFIFYIDFLGRKIYNFATIGNIFLVA